MKGSIRKVVAGIVLGTLLLPQTMCYASTLNVSATNPAPTGSEAVRFNGGVASDELNQAKKYGNNTNNNVNKVFDGDEKTSWQTDKGDGQYLILNADKEYYFKYIGLKAGVWNFKNGTDYFWQNSRPKHITIEIGSNKYETDLPNEKSEYFLTLPEAVPGNQIKITIDSLYSARYKDTGFSEIRAWAELPPEPSVDAYQGIFTDGNTYLYIPLYESTGNTDALGVVYEVEQPDQDAAGYMNFSISGSLGSLYGDNSAEPSYSLEGNHVQGSVKFMESSIELTDCGGYNGEYTQCSNFGAGVNRDEIWFR